MVWGATSSLGAFSESVGKVLIYPLLGLYEFMVLPGRKTNLVSARKVTHIFHQVIFRVHPGYWVPNRTNLKNARYSVILLWRQLNLVITKGLYYPSTYLVKMWQIIEFVMLGTTFELFLLLFILLTISSLYSSSTESGNAISVAWRWSCGTAPIECALFTFTFSP